MAESPPPAAGAARDLRGRPFAWITGLVFASQAVFVAFAPFERLALYVNDDAYYYIMVARHWVEGGFPSLDGVTPTNGFQPLWQVLQLPLALVGSRLVHLRLALLLGALLFQLGLLGTSAALKRISGAPVALAFLLILEANPLVTWGFALNGMESSLQVGLLGAALALLTARAGLARQRLWLLGLVVGLYGATRLDGLALVPCVAAFVVWRERRLCAAVPVVLLGFAPALAFMVASQLWFGTPLPVSGQVKMVINQRFLDASEGGLGERTATGATNLVRSGYYVASRVTGGTVSFAARAAGVGDRVTGAVAGIAGALAAAIGLAMLLRQRSLAALAPLVAAAAATAIRLLVFAAAYPFTFHLYDWYFADAVVLTAVFLAPLAAAALRFRALALVAGGLVAVNATCFASDSGNLGHFQPVLDAVAYVDSRPELSTARVASWDAGLVAFSLASSVTNLDGLVNSPAFLHDYVQGLGAVGDYLRDRNIEVVVNLLSEPAERIRRDGFRGLTAADAKVVYVSPTYPAPFGEARRCAVFLVR